MKSRSGPTEEAIQVALVGHLTWRLAPEVWWCAIPNGGKRHAAVAAKLKAAGVRSGAPDMVFLAGGTLYALELKRGRGGRVSPEQAAHGRMITEAGGTFAIAHGLDAALQQLTDWGLVQAQPRRPRARVTESA